MTTLDRPKLPWALGTRYWASGTISRPLSLGLSVHLNMQSTKHYVTRDTHFHGPQANSRLYGPGFLFSFSFFHEV